MRTICGSSLLSIAISGARERMIASKSRSGLSVSGAFVEANVVEETSHTIDEEIRSFIDRNYERAERLIKENIDILHAMAAALMKYETIDKYQIEDLMARKPVRDPEGWGDDKPPHGDIKVDEIKVNDDVKNVDLTKPAQQN